MRGACHHFQRLINSFSDQETWKVLHGVYMDGSVMSSTSPRRRFSQRWKPIATSILVAPHTTLLSDCLQLYLLLSTAVCANFLFKNKMLPSHTILMHLGRAVLHRGRSKNHKHQANGSRDALPESQFKDAYHSRGRGSHSSIGFPAKNKVRKGLGGWLLRKLSAPYAAWR